MPTNQSEQARQRHRNIDGTFAKELDDTGFPGSDTLSKYEQKRLQEQEKTTQSPTHADDITPISLPEGWVEQPASHNGVINGCGNSSSTIRRFNGPDSSRLTVEHKAGYEKDYGEYDEQYVTYQAGPVTIKRILPPISQTDVNELVRTGERLEQYRAMLNNQPESEYAAPVIGLEASTSETGFTCIRPEYGEPPKEPYLPWNRNAWLRAREAESQARVDGLVDIPPLWDGDKQVSENQ